MAPSQVAPAKANIVLPEHQHAHSPHLFLHTAHHSDRFVFKPTPAADSQGLTGCSQKKATKPDAGNHRYKDSPDHNKLEHGADSNDIQDNEDLFRNIDDSHQQHKQDKHDSEHDDKQDNEQDNKQDNKQDNEQDNKQDKHEEPDHEQDEHDEQYSREDPQTGRDGNHNHDDPMEDQTPGKDSQADNEIDPGIFDVLERHQAKNGWYKAPSPSHLLSALTCMHWLKVSPLIHTPTCISSLIY
ncbi:hypothetical protein EDB19DRAFT_1917433 [Suillus lakei]|nr:hypothetical protein EDB19DRAFT_1917433 [Suillus lakei]